MANLNSRSKPLSVLLAGAARWQAIAVGASECQGSGQGPGVAYCNTKLEVPSPLLAFACWARILCRAQSPALCLPSVARQPLAQRARPPPNLHYCCLAVAWCPGGGRPHLFLRLPSSVVPQPSSTAIVNVNVHSQCSTRCTVHSQSSLLHDMPDTGQHTLLRLGKGGKLAVRLR